VEPYAGTGQEAGTDGQRTRSAFAQPSGLTADAQKLYIADSEISTIRYVEFPPGDRAGTVAGSSKLFDFGDVDGKGSNARLQHPLGVAYHDGVVYVADTYNNKIKQITLSDGHCQTFLGTGEAGLSNDGEVAFDEPAGIAYAGGKLYVADTNNHVIRAIDVATRAVETLPLQAPAADADAPAKADTTQSGSVKPGDAKLTVEINLPEGRKLNELAPSNVKIVSSDGEVVAFDSGPEKTIQKDFKLPLIVPFTAEEGTATLKLEFTVYTCETADEGLCYFNEFSVGLDVTVTPQAADSGIRVTRDLIEE